ncbi:MAG: hypothetical protein IPN70_01735 [Candidatus Moraniibacteriota bacterium]|nr:MAG: hypothetical protein IPN70_01735 [Candidatus Moranbacteria bacterium]
MIIFCITLFIVFLINQLPINKNQENIKTPDPIKEKMETKESPSISTIEDLTFNTPEEIATWIQNNPNDPRINEVKQKFKSMGYSIEEFTKDQEAPQATDPSDRALKASLFWYNNIPKERQDKMKQTWGGGSDDHYVAVKNFAIALDTKREWLIDVELIIEEYKSKQNTSYTQPSTKNPKTIPSNENSNSELDDMIQESERKKTEKCQRDLAEYNACLTEYNAEMAEYNACLNQDNPYKYCSKPFGSFCVKPFCF